MNLKTILSLCIGIYVYTTPTFASDYQIIRNIIEKDPSIRHIDQLLGHLDSDLLDNYLLLHNSNSLQQANLDSPRVILHNSDASFIMAFNGNPNLGGYNRLEMIQFNQTKNQFEFYEAQFPEGDDGAVVFSEKNPEECQSCHRVDLRPNWDAYPFWKDAYGSIENSDSTRVDMFPETKLFKNFLATADQNKRYQHIPNLKNQTVNSMAQRNLSFNKAAASLNFRRIAENLKSTPEFAKYKYAFLGAIRRCPIESFIPTAIQNNFANKLSYYLEQANKADFRIQQERSAFIKSSSTFYRAEIIGAIRYLLEGRQLPTGSWSMVLGDESFNMSTGAYGVEELGSVMISAIPELKGLGCEELKRKSLAAFSDQVLDHE